MRCLGTALYRWPQTQHVNRPQRSIKDMQMYTSPRAKLLLLREGLQTTTNILPIALCHPGHEAHHSTGMYNLWVRPNIKILLFFLSTFDASVFEPHLSLGNRDPLNNPFFMLFIQSTWLDVFALQLKAGQRNSVSSIAFSLLRFHAHSSTEQVYRLQCK